MIAPLPAQPPLALPRRSTFDVRGKTSDAIQHHYDPSIPGKPLFYMVPGGLLGVASLSLMVWTLYRMIIQQTLPAASGQAMLILLGVMYIAGVFVFCYGYERFDLNATIKMTCWIVLLTVLVVVMIAALFLVLSSLLSGKSGGGGGGGSSRSSRSDSSSTTANWQQASASSTYTTSSQPIYHATPQHYAAPIYLPPIYAPPAAGTTTIINPSSPAPTPSPAVPQGAPQPVPHQVVCRYCHNVTTITGDAFNCPKCGAPNLPGDLTSGSGVGLTAGGMPLTTPAAFKAVFGVTELRWIGLQPSVEEPEVSVDEGNGVTATWTSGNSDDHGIELDVFNSTSEDPAQVLKTIVGEGGGTPVPAQLSGADEAYEGQTDEFAWLAVRRGPLVYGLSIPPSERASQQLAYLGGLVLHRVSTG